MRIGAQLYTVREFTQTQADFAETLKKVADIGYRTVQVSGSGPFDPAWLAAELKKNDLICPLTHTAPDRIASETAAVIEEHKLFDCPIVGIGAAPGIFNYDSFDYAAFCDRFRPAAESLKAAGMLLAYHNHHFEFYRSDGPNMLERLAADFAADTLTFVLDTYWIQFAGGDPAAWIRKFADRAQCVHLKDMAIVGTQQMAVIGEGNINFDTIFAACEDARTQYLLVEQDDCYGENPFDCLRRSYEYLRARGYE